jgi:protein PhnA
MAINNQRSITHNMSYSSKLIGICLVSRVTIASSFSVASTSMMWSRPRPQLAPPARNTVVGPAVPTMGTLLFSSAVPVPSSCPECQDDATYWDGSTLFICTSCAHEWPIGDSAALLTADDDNDDGAETRDRNGNILKTNDMCVLIQDLAKGKLKKGLKVKIRVGDYGDGHDCEATIPGVGTYALKSEFLKKV